MTGPDDAAGAAPACPGPPSPSAGTRFVVPEGAVDTHAHVIGVPPAYPFVAERRYTPPEATEADYLRMLDVTGMTYGVLVQVSVHGVDNRLMMKALAAHPRRLRGVAVVGLDTPGAVLQGMREARVRGLRLNVLYGGGAGLGELAEYGALCREMGWHLQFLVDGRLLPELAGPMGRLGVPIVIDHMGHLPPGSGVGAPGFQTLLGMVRDGAWVKLSGAYRLAGAPWGETTALARSLLEAGPGRCVWGSDWAACVDVGGDADDGGVVGPARGLGAGRGGAAGGVGGEPGGFIRLLGGLHDDAVVGAAEVDQAFVGGTELDGLDGAEKDGVGADFGDVGDGAVEGDDGVLQDGGAGFEGGPFAGLKAFDLGDTGEPGEEGGEVFLGSG